jgi:hypothetical protein
VYKGRVALLLDLFLCDNLGFFGYIIDLILKIKIQNFGTSEAECQKGVKNLEVVVNG